MAESFQIVDRRWESLSLEEAPLIIQEHLKELKNAEGGKIKTHIKNSIVLSKIAQLYWLIGERERSVYYQIRSVKLHNNINIKLGYERSIIASDEAFRLIKMYWAMEKHEEVLKAAREWMGVLSKGFTAMPKHSAKAWTLGVCAYGLGGLLIALYSDTQTEHECLQLGQEIRTMGNEMIRINEIQYS